MLGRVDRPQQDDVGQPKPDPGAAEDGGADGHGERLARLRDALEQEREHEGGHEPAHHPDRAAEPGAEHGQDAARVPREHEWAQRPRDPEELVQGDHGPDGGEGEQPPPSEPDEVEDDGQPNDRHQQPREERFHRPP